jgi:hypothetical protein
MTQHRKKKLPDRVRDAIHTKPYAIRTEERRAIPNVCQPYVVHSASAGDKFTTLRGNYLRKRFTQR